MHSVTRCRDFNYIPWLGTGWIWLPKLVFILGSFSILTSFCLGMLWVFQSMVSIGNANSVNIKSELPTFSKMQDTFMGAAPIGT